MCIRDRSTAIEQLSRESDRLAGQISRVTKSMTEQARSAQEITTAADGLRQQSTQAARAMEEQTKAIRDITVGASDIGKQIKLISKANIDHSRNGERMLQRLREVTEVSAATATETRAITTGMASLGSGLPTPDDPATEATAPRKRSRKSQPSEAPANSI